MNKLLLIVALLLFVAVPARGETWVQDCPWGPEMPPGVTIAGLGAPGGAVVGVAGPTPSEGLCILTVPTPGLTSRHIALQGKLSLHKTLGTVTLTMWAEFPDGKSYFSKLQFDPSSSAALPRDFRLPMHSNETSAVRLTLWVHTGSPGEITLMPVSLWDITPAVRAWWNDRAGGWIGGILGSAIGLLGAVIGILRARGSSERVISVFSLSCILLGMFLLAGGVVSLFFLQPYRVYYPLLLCGILTTTVFGVLYFQSRRQSQQNELRKIHALDA